MSISSFTQGRRAADAELDLLAQTADGRVAAAKTLLRGMQFGDSAFDRGYRSALIAAKNAGVPGVVAALVDPLAVFTPEARADRVARRRAQAHSAGRILMGAAVASGPARAALGVFEVVIACDEECGRTITHHGVAATSPAAARQVAIERMHSEGWRLDDGRVTCRSCLLRAAGWASNPGPAELGHAMTVEAIATHTDHSRTPCACESARATPVPAQPDASPTASPRGRGVGASGTSFTRN